MGCQIVSIRVQASGAANAPGARPSPNVAPRVHWEEFPADEENRAVQRQRQDRHAAQNTARKRYSILLRSRISVPSVQHPSRRGGPAFAQGLAVGSTEWPCSSRCTSGCIRRARAAAAQGSLDHAESRRRDGCGFVGCIDDDGRSPVAGPIARIGRRAGRRSARSGIAAARCEYAGRGSALRRLPRLSEVSRVHLRAVVAHAHGQHYYGPRGQFACRTRRLHQAESACHIQARGCGIRVRNQMEAALLPSTKE